jgi:hypothetical protein
MLVVIVVIALLAGFLLQHYTKGTKTPAGKTVAAPKEQAQGVECMTNLRQLRQAYTMATATGEEQKPRSLADLKPVGVTESIARCPVGKMYYLMDPNNGRFACPHPGHQQY